VPNVHDTDPTAALAATLALLRNPESYPEKPARIDSIETHMSWVFLTDTTAYKLKKPVRYDYLDFSTPALRRRFCEEELRLNRRLAPSVYRGVVPITSGPAGELHIDGTGHAVDWLVEMRRLPHKRMLDHLLREGRLTDAEIDALAQRLADFYRLAERSNVTPGDYLGRFFDEQAKNRDILTCREFALDHGRATLILDRLDARLVADRPLLEERVHARRIVDGHGDLRPEHICFDDPIAIFDCLEFNAALRQVDPFDELAFLGMECAQLGAPHIGTKLQAKLSGLLGDPAPARLISLYAAWRAMLRARLTLAHLLDPAPRLPEKWEPLASRYLALAEAALS